MDAGLKRASIAALILGICTTGSARAQVGGPGADIDDLISVKKVTRNYEGAGTHHYVQITSESASGITIIAAKINHGACFVDPKLGPDLPTKLDYGEKLRISSRRGGGGECNPTSIEVETNRGAKLYRLAGP